MTAPVCGVSLVGGETARGSGRTFRAVDAATGAPLQPAFHAASPADVDEACARAEAAFESFATSSGAQRATLLRAIAAELETRAGDLVARAGLECALPAARLEGEFARTTAQLRVFATVADADTWRDVRIEPGDPNRTPLPRPDLRSLRVPVGPVVVFGASNFPLAFSVAGGDTASALAAGNPVIVKAHPAHPGTSALAGAAIAAAVERCALPGGTFALLFDEAFAVGEQLVRHPRVRAVGFTGSRAGGEALLRLAAAGPQPIPVYAEMGSVNPVVVLAGALRERLQAIATGLHASFTLGVGQLCTSPGLVLVPAGADGDAFAEALAALTRATSSGALLTAAIGRRYEAGLARLQSLGATLLARGTGAAAGRAALWQVDAQRFLAHPDLRDEVFGPSTLLVRTAEGSELLAVVRALEGQLTATIHGAASEADRELVAALVQRAGRIVFDQFPTGVEVNTATVHGGPYPASSDGRSTSVGTRAIERFTRLVAYQNAPADILPPELR